MEYQLNSLVSGFSGRGRLVEVFKDEKGKIVFRFDILEDTNNCKDLHGDDERGYWFLPEEIDFPSVAHFLFFIQVGRAATVV